MSRRGPKEHVSTKDVVEELAETSESVENAPEVEAAPKPEQKTESADKKVVPMLTFDRWFSHTKKPLHHKAGMLVWMKKQPLKKVKMTVAEWNALFSKY